MRARASTPFRKSKTSLWPCRNARPSRTICAGNIPFEGVTIVPYPGNVAQFLADENFAQQGYIFSEPFVAKTKGGDPKALLVADTGFNPYTSVLITTEERIAAEPELVGAVVRASVKGWEQYLAEPEATNRHINSLNPEMSMDILAYGAAESIAMILDPVAQQNGLGSMTLQRWQKLLEQMVTIGLIKDGVVDAAQQSSPTASCPSLA